MLILLSTSIPPVASKKERLPHPLPVSFHLFRVGAAGWGRSVTPLGEVYYVNHVTKTTTWSRPKMEPAVEDSKSAGMIFVSWSCFCGKRERQSHLGKDHNVEHFVWVLHVGRESFLADSPSHTQPPVRSALKKYAPKLAWESLGNRSQELTLLCGIFVHAYCFS